MSPKISKRFYFYSYHISGKACAKTAKEITNVLEKVRLKLPQHVDGRINEGEDYIDQYAIYR
jgi:hypothetical protein